MSFVLDSSAAFGFAAPDEFVSRAIEERISSDAPFVPSLWPFEVASALRRSELQGRFSTAEARAVADVLGRLRVTFDDVSIERVLNPVLDVSRRMQLSVYDAAFVELAARLSVPLATNDARLRRAAVEAGIELVE